MTPAAFKRFFWALALSLLVHLIVTFGPSIPLPEYQPDPVMEASIRPLPPPPPAVKKPRPRPRLAPRKPPEPATSGSPPAPESVVAAEPEQASAATQEEPSPPAPPESIIAEEAPITLPEHAEIRYTLYKGRDGFPVGKAVHTWKREGKSYSITQIAEASGIVSFFYSGRHVQISQGVITASGMQPDSYWVQRGQRADRTDTAKFDWNDRQLTFGTGSDTRTVRLPDGTQDLLSFLYQLAFAPPLEGSTRLHITTGRKLGNYGYESRGEETLETPLGLIKTLRIAQLRQEGEENTEIWLATEYHYLPLKIRFTDKQGSVMEQTAAAIDIK
ncbi:MAG: DUF3108 domain-containing protein [Gammaproteobacteria bacterium]|nr:DUF3108 domain-containing protein [Gammaproteobacteria bacterium]MBU1733387.1 DUF3108 domain-containing protein [Gammaproteobacteria bacterium]MBU1891804.1 DUF3108 domain-containing protein [Gammaproteobacteria bacterium]